MVSNSTLQFLQAPELLRQLEEDNTFISFEKQENQNTEFKIVKLGFFESILRKLFGSFGLYRSTHKNEVLSVLKAELKPLISFQDNVSDIKKVVRIARKVLNLHTTSDELSQSVTDEVTNKITRPEDRDTFKKTVAFVERNLDQIRDLKNEGAGFTLKANGEDRLRVAVNAEGIKILGRKILGAGGFKKVKTAFDVEKSKPLARAVMVVSNPNMNFLQRTINNLFSRARFAQNELHFLKQVRGEPTCIQLDTSYMSVNKRGYHKLNMLMELADGDLSDLLRTRNLSEVQLLDITSQLIDSIVALSRREIWHRDIKPLNFLYTAKDNDRYDVRLADFGLAVPNRDVIAEKFPAGTYGYMAPENNRFFRLTNGKEGDIYSLGQTLDDIFPFGRSPQFIRDLIAEMLRVNPQERPSAEELQRKFREELTNYNAEMAAQIIQQ